MSVQSFDHILGLIDPLIREEDTNYRKALAPDLKLALTFHYLASKPKFGNIHKHWRVGKSTAAQLVVEVAQAIWTKLSPVYLRQPQSQADWEEIARGFSDNWNFPNCLGAIDGEYFEMQFSNIPTVLYCVFSTLLITFADMLDHVCKMLPS